MKWLLGLIIIILYSCHSNLQHNTLTSLVMFLCEILCFSSLCSGYMARVFITEWSVDIRLTHIPFDWSDQYWESWSWSNLLGCEKRAQWGIQPLLAVKYIHPQYSWPTYSIALLIWERHCYAFFMVLLEMFEGHIP